jgi:hypothetical protein
LPSRARPVIGGQDTCKIRCAARQALSALLQVWRVKFECAMAGGERNAMTEGRCRLIGSTASPCAIKLRYRGIMTKALWKATEHLRPNLIPVQMRTRGFPMGFLWLCWIIILDPDTA